MLQANRRTVESWMARSMGENVMWLQKLITLNATFSNPSYCLLVPWSAISEKIEWIHFTNLELRQHETVLETIPSIQKPHLNPNATTVKTCGKVAVSQGIAVFSVVSSIYTLINQENFIRCNWPFSLTNI